MPQKQIGGNVFHVNSLPAMRSFALQSKIAPALGQVFGALGTIASSLADTDVSALAPAIAGFFAKLGPDDLEAVTRQLLADATIDGKPLFTPSGDPFNIFMAGRTLDTWRLLWFAIEVNYPDFFGLLGAKANKPEEKNGLGSKVSSTSPGPVGASL